MNLPGMESPVSFPSNEPLMTGICIDTIPEASGVHFAGIPLAPCAGESRVQPSAEKLNTTGSVVPPTLSSPFQLPDCAAMPNTVSVAMHDVMKSLLGIGMIFFGIPLREGPEACA